MNKYVLLGKCDDKIGIVAMISEWVHHINGNILDLEQFVHQEDKRFFIRLEWSLENFLDKSKLYENFQKNVAQKLKMQFSIRDKQKNLNMAIFVSRLDHCLWDLLARYHKDSSPAKVSLIVSNHKICEPIAKMFGIKFIFVDFQQQSKEEIEAYQLRVLENYSIDFVVLARYMQVLSDNFIQKWENKIINIHHSFLPAFPGAKPYHQAHRRGVKVVGASAHYVTPELDAGPIIEQEVVRVTHHDDVNRLLNKGQELEKIVLSRAVTLYINHSIIVEKNRTYILY